MIKVGRLNLLTLLALPLIALAFVACGGNGETNGDGPSTTDVSETLSVDSFPATPVAEAQDASGASLDEYLMAVCGGQEELADWEEDVSLREISAGLEQHIEIMESLEPPAEVSDWHDAGLAFQNAFKQTVDHYLEDPQGQSEDEFLFSMFFSLASDFAPVEEAIAAMDPDVRSRMIEAGCIDEETTTTIEIEAPTIGVGDNSEVPLDTGPDSPTGVSAVWEGAAIRVSWNPVEGADYYNVYHDQGGYACSLYGSGGPSWCDELAANVVGTSYTHASPSTLIPNHYWVVACNSDGCSAIDPANPATPAEGLTLSSPTNQQYVILGNGSQVRITWDEVDGADFYYVYHNNQPSCSADDSGSSCEQLPQTLGPPGFHTSPDPVDNYYWVVACTFNECSEIDLENPAKPE